MVDLTEKYTELSKKLAARGEIYNPNYLMLKHEMGNYRYYLLQGGQRSGKTVSTVQILWWLMEQYSGIEISVVRESMPTLKATVLTDLIEWGLKAGLYKDSLHNKTEGWYRDTKGNKIDFIGAEDEEKLRGRKRDILYVNEAGNLSWEVIEQLRGRTNGIIIMDYNPSYPESWIYDRIMPSDRCAFIKTTYKDNPHLTANLLEDIEDMRINDPDRYRIYGMGERGLIRGQIYSNWVEIPDKQFPKDANLYVVDFGYSSDPCAIVRGKIEGKTAWFQEKVYRTGMTNIDIGIALFFEGCTDKCVLIADSAEPKSIGELRNGWDLKDDDIAERAAELGYEFSSREQFQRLQKVLKDGYHVYGAVKGQDSIRTGIQRVQQYNVMVTSGSKNIWKEYSKYKWKEDPHTGKTLPIPDKRCADHGLDGIRYLATSHGRLF